MIPITVHCKAGDCSERVPERFYIKDLGHAVVEILDRWLATDHRYFKVLADDQGRYILRHDGATDEWHLVSFDAAGVD